MFVVGLDLGQRQDYTALCVVEKQERRSEKPLLLVRHLERFPLGTPYSVQMDRVRDLVKDLWRQRPGVELVVDATGVGAGVIEMLKERNLSYRGVTITAGTNESMSGKLYHVPKRNLVSRAIAPFEDRRLKISKGLDLVDTLLGELDTFKVKVTTAGNDTYEHWRDSDHDDLVLALALACWWCERRHLATVHSF